MSSRRIYSPSVSSQVTCPAHSEPMKLYCFDCDQLICRDCTLIDHCGHRFEFLSKCAPKSRGRIGNLTTPLLKVQANIFVAEKRLEGVERKIGQQEEVVMASIKVAFDRMRGVLDVREVELANKLSMMAQEKRSALSEQMHVLQTAEMEIQRVLDSVHQALENASNNEFMAMSSELESRVEAEHKRHRNLPLKPKVVADLACDLPTAEPAKAKVGDVFHASIDRLSIGEVGKSSKVTLKLQGAKNLKNLRVAASLKSLANPAAGCQVLVTPKGHQGIFEINFVPQMRGRHDLAVMVNEGDVPGSPFRLFVKIPPVKLGFPIMRSEPFGKPYGLAINSKGQLLVSENSGKRITFVDAKCRKLHSIVSDQFYYPRGVVASPTGAVFTTDKGKESNIMKFEGMRLVKGVARGSRSVTLLKLINNHLYACDMGISEVHILTQDLMFVRSFPTPQVPSPHDIAEGEDGLYVAGGAEVAQIGVYTHDGEFIRHFVVKGHSFTLSAIRGICFDSYGNMFITQAGEVAGGVDGGIYVFASTGQFLTSFGLVRAGVMGYPVGIVIDDDGFVYVNDHVKGGSLVVF